MLSRFTILTVSSKKEHTGNHHTQDLQKLFVHDGYGSFKTEQCDSVAKLSLLDIKVLLGLII